MAIKQKPTAIVPWEQRFAQYAKVAVENEKGIGGGGTAVKFGAGGTITVAGGLVPGSKLEVIVLAACNENAWYGGKPYDPDDIQPPECYAIGEVMDDLAPGEEVSNKQSDSCSTCEKNEFGSADTGRGKACSNKKRLCVILSKDVDDAASAATAEFAMAKISTTNMKGWAGFVRGVADETGRPPWAVVAEISGYPDQKNQYRLEFRMVETIDDHAVLDALFARTEKALAYLQEPYGPPTECAAKKPAARGNTQKFAGGKRK